MPIYEYRCTACQHKLEALQKFSDPRLTVCPQCGQDALTKLVSAAGFHLKGSGWYQTDFKNSGSKPAAKSDAGNGETKTAEAAPASKGDAPAKSDAPASKAETPAAPASSAPAAT